MNKRRKTVEIIAAGLLAAAVSACVSQLGGSCARTASGGLQCSGGYEPEINEIGM